jgi:hypothetical protein
VTAACSKRLPQSQVEFQSNCGDGSDALWEARKGRVGILRAGSGYDHAFITGFEGSMNKVPQRASYRSNLLSSVGGDHASLNEGIFQEVPEIRAKAYLVDSDQSSPSKFDAFGGSSAADKEFRSLPFAAFDLDEFKSSGLNGASETEEILDFSQLEKDLKNTPSAGSTNPQSSAFSGFAAAATDAEAAHVDPSRIYALRKQHWKQQVDEVNEALSLCNGKIKEVIAKCDELDNLRKNLALQHAKLQKRKDEVGRRKEKRDKERERDKLKQKEANAAIMKLMENTKLEAKEKSKVKSDAVAARRLENKRIAAELTGDLDDDGVFIDEADNNIGCWGILVKSISSTLKDFESFLERKDGMHSSAVTIEARFGITYRVYFDFLRWNVYCTLKVLLLWLIFFMLHVVSASRFVTSFSAVWTSALETVPAELKFPYSQVFVSQSAFWPSFLLLSSFDAPNFFTVFLMVTMLIYIKMSVGQLHEKRVLQKRFYVESANSSDQYSLLVLGGWDWTSQLKEEVFLQQTNLAARLKLLLNRAHDMNHLESLSLASLLMLYAKRGMIFLSWVSVLTVGFVVIIGVNFLPNDGNGPFFVTKQIAPAVVNAVLPMATNFCVKLEKWDAVTEINQLMYRLYTARILNVSLQLVVFYFLLVGTPSSLVQYGLPQFIELRDCAFRSCEDQVGTRIFILYVTDVIVACTIAIFVPLVQKTVMPALGFEFQKQEFQVPPNVIKGLYQQMLLWACLPFFPSAALFAPFLQYLAFNVEVYYVNENCIRPFELLNVQEAKASLSVQMMKLYNGCLALASCVFVYVLTSFSFQSYNVDCCHLNLHSKCVDSAINASSCPALQGVMFYGAAPLQLWANSAPSAATSWLVEPIFIWIVAFCCLILAAWRQALMKSYVSYLSARRQLLNENIAILGKMFKRQQRLINLRKKH